LTGDGYRAIVISEGERRPFMKEIRRILAICRMVTHCSEVVHYGALLARQFSAELFVMNVIYDPFGIKGWNLPLPSLEADYRKLLEKTRKDLHDIIARENQQGMAIHELVREGKPADEIRKVITEEKIDLLVLAAHEESRLEHVLFGRDNEELIRKMPCSILFVKSEPGAVIEEEEQEVEEREQG
jgi:nucleotide-binding universal stress UspA family protein